MKVLRIDVRKYGVYGAMDNFDLVSLMAPGLRVGLCQSVATLMSALWLELLLVRRRKPWVIV